MAISFTTKDLLQKEIIRNLDNRVVIVPYANRKFEGELKAQGNTVTVQTLPDVTWRVGGTAGASITNQNFTVSAENLVVDKVAQILIQYSSRDSVEYNRDLRGDIAARIGEDQAQLLDKHVASFVKDAGTKLNTDLSVTRSSSNMQSIFEEMGVEADENSVPMEGAAYFVDPQGVSFLRQNNWLDAIEAGYQIRSKGVMGMFNGRDVVKTNNLPAGVDLTIDTQPTAGDTFTLSYTKAGTTYSVVFTYTAAGAAAAAGDIALGATLADTQANTVNAINGTGTAGASTYVAVSATDREDLETAMVYASDFSSDVSVIYSNVVLTTAETFTAATNVFSNSSKFMFLMDSSTVNHVNQLNNFDVRELTDAFSFNVLGEMIYGGKVFAENAKRLVSYRFAV